MNEYAYSVINPRTARTLYNKKDAFGVKHDTENEQSRAELDTVRAKTSSLVGKIISISEQSSECCHHDKIIARVDPVPAKVKTVINPSSRVGFY